MEDSANQNCSLHTQYGHCGKSPALSASDVRKIERALLRDPFLSNDELAAVVGFKVTGRAVGNYVNRSHHNFVSKLVQEDAEATFTQKHKEEGMTFISKSSMYCSCKKGIRG